MVVFIYFFFTVLLYYVLHVRFHCNNNKVALNCFVFEKIAYLHFGVKLQDGGSPSDLRHLGF